MKTSYSLRSWMTGLTIALASMAYGQSNYLETGLLPTRTVVEGKNISLYAEGAQGSVQWQILAKNTSLWTDLVDDGTYSGTKSTSLEIIEATSVLGGSTFRYTSTASGVTSVSRPMVLNVTPVLLPEPTGLFVDAAGNLIVSDATIHMIGLVDGARWFGWGNDVGCPLYSLVGKKGQAGAIDGAGTAALFNHPSGLATAGDDSYLVADTGNGMIRVVKGVAVTILAGSSTERGNVDGIGAVARFTAPVNIAKSLDGSFYVVDSTNHTVRKIAADGTVSTFAGSAGNPGIADGIGLAARFNNPTGIAVDENGNVYVADTGNNLIRKISPVGTVTTLAGVAGVAGSDDGPGDQALFNGPTGLWAGALGYLWVVDTGNSTIRQIFPDGTVRTMAGVPGVAGLRDAVSHPVGTYYYGGYDNVLFDHPRALAFDNTGLLFIADTGNAAIRVISFYDGWCMTLPLGGTLSTAVPPPLPTTTTSTTTTTTSPTPPTSAPKISSSSGGGGAPSVWYLLALAGAFLLRRLTARRSAGGGCSA